MRGGRLEHNFLMQTSEMTHSNRNFVGNNDSCLPNPTSKQLPVIIIDVLDEMSSGMLYTAGFLLFFCFTCHLVLFSYGEEN